MIKKSIYLMSAMTVASMVLVGCGAKTFVVYSPGENLTSLTKVNESEYVCFSPCGGDDGRNLFFVVQDKAGFQNIYRKDVPTSMSMSQITGGQNFNSAPSYCAATNSLVFSGKQTGSSVHDIYMVNATQGGALKQVTNTSDYEEFTPCISGDGSKILYSKGLRGTDAKSYEIWVKNLMTNENTQLGLGCNPTFSPDAKMVAFVKFAPDNYTTCLFVCNADGTNVTQLTDVSMGSVYFPCFSPDGKKIVFSCMKTKKNDYDLYTIDINGNNLTQLTINKSYDAHPYWANDGNIYFASDRGDRAGHYQIWRFFIGKTNNPVRGNTTTYVGNTTTVTPEVQNRQNTFVSQPRYHTVQSGETITDIARKYGITVRDVVSWNKLTTMTINAGMRLKVSQ